MALDTSKTDSALGKEIHKLLVKKGVETPLANHKFDKEHNKLAAIERSFEVIMQNLGLDLTDDSLRGTPRRVAKMFLQETMWGLDYNNFPKMMAVENKMKYGEIVIERNINVVSQCEHHWVPIIGKAHVAYIPDKKVQGLSKINRVVEFFSRRPQVQERLTNQIYWAIAHIMQTENVVVIIKADHFCVKTRGVEDQTSDTITSKIGGVFEAHAARNELMQLLKL